MPRNGGGGPASTCFLTISVANISTKRCETSFDFHITNRSRSETSVLRGFRIINPQRRSTKCRGMAEEDLQALDFCQFLLQTFQHSSVRRIFILATQTAACPKRPFCEVSESPIPSAVAPNAAKWRRKTYKHTFFCLIVLPGLHQTATAIPELFRLAVLGQVVGKRGNQEE